MAGAGPLGSGGHPSFRCVAFVDDFGPFLDCPIIGSGAQTLRHPRGAPAIPRPWHGPRDLGATLGTSEGRVRGVGGRGSDPRRVRVMSGHGGGRLRTAVDVN